MVSSDVVTVLDLWQNLSPSLVLELRVVQYLLMRPHQSLGWAVLTGFMWLGTTLNIDELRVMVFGRSLIICVHGELW